MCNTTIIEKEQTLNVKGRNITILAPIRICDVCGDEILDKELDSITLNRFYDEYRKLENLLSPSEIKTIRLKYNLSQTSFAKFLGFGEKTITRYENGAIQDVCHDNLIRLMNSLDSFALLWDERKELVNPKERTYIERKLATYNKTKINSTYIGIPQYYTSSPTMYTTQGGLSDAG
jgi:putative zinc finger/helix-turn-helix YgiT family protein